MAGEGVRETLLVEDLGQAALDATTGRVDLLERVGLLDDRQGLDRGRGGDPVAGIRPAVADVVRKDAHDLRRSTEGGGRVAVAHRLGEGREVRRHTEEFGRPAAGEAEPSS